MKKKFIWIISLTVMVLGFLSCGGGSSKEARELLQKILQFVGIPHSIIVNVCQDSNGDGLCGSKELFTKITIRKGDNIDDILQKISLTDDGKYFLETLNPQLPILVEFQDRAKVNYDDGRFTLVFNGFTTKDDDNESKEISILESMVDADALTKVEADSFRTLDNVDAQEKYYVSLLSSLETNINTLREQGVESRRAVTLTIKEMADETRANQDKADSINECKSDQVCVDEKIKEIFDELIITEDEKVDIVESNNTLAPQSERLATSGIWKKPIQSVCEENGGIYNKNRRNECYANWENANSICQASGDILPSITELKGVVTDCGGVVDDSDNNIENNAYQSCYRDKGFIGGDYWSSTETPDGASAEYLYFAGGNSFSTGKESENAIQCIR